MSEISHRSLLKLNGATVAAVAQQQLTLSSEASLNREGR